MPVVGADTIAKNITSFGGGFKAHVKKVIGEVVKNLDGEVTKNMTLTCHSQEDLNALDHPYAVRHGSRGIEIHDPYWQVHMQSGKLLQSKRRGVTDVAIVNGNLSVAGYVTLDENAVPYAASIIWGTWSMIPRDFLTGSLMDEKFRAYAKEYIATNLRQMVVGFRGVETR